MFQHLDDYATFISKHVMDILLFCTLNAPAVTFLSFSYSNKNNLHDIRKVHAESNFVLPKQTSSDARLTLRLLMSDIYMERLFLMFLDYTQRRSTVGRTPLDE